MVMGMCKFRTDREPLESNPIVEEDSGQWALGLLMNEVRMHVTASAKMNELPCILLHK